MTATRNRRLLIIGVLATLFALGGGCLAYLATASGGSAAGSNAAGAGQPSALASSDEFPSGTAGAPGADSSGSSGSSGGGDDEGAPPRPGQNVPTTGINLDGNGDTTCFVVLPFTNQIQTPLRVDAVQVRSTNGAIVHDPGGCSNCPGTVFGPDGPRECKVGVRLSGNRPYPENVSVTVRLSMAATCTDSSRKPCDSPRVAALSPSARNPVALRVIGTLVRSLDLSDLEPGDETDDEGPDSPPDEGGPASPDPGEAPSTPDTRSVPEPAPSEMSS